MLQSIVNKLICNGTSNDETAFVCECRIFHSLYNSLKYQKPLQLIILILFDKPTMLTDCQ